ncbi:Variant surface glycoprotein [Trypanosoma congolense IL3000]|uniref:Variant surface glycoprotein n=1 Tax=Trypanosoma congolense (strain IL3000) TaxID=1068625 RepID=F9WAR6_TRYCI|nr:Variant surface glycoprotein [Trypanosoma congolense IL3000]
MIKFGLLLVTVILVFVESEDMRDYNKDDYKLLCDLIGAAVKKWGEVRESGGPLRDALKRTLFGKESENNDLSKLNFPEDYTKKVDGDLKNSRKHWCGGCTEVGQKHHPGESALHDLVCLCAPGQYGWPISGDDEKKLCGKNQSNWILTGGEMKGWYTVFLGEKDQEREQMSETWETIIKDCVRGGDGNDLQTALQAITEKTRKVGVQYLGKHGSGYSCGGTAGDGVCVRYPPECVRNTWWKELEDAIMKYKEESEKEDTEQKKSESSEKGQKLKASKGEHKAQRQSSHSPQPASRVSFSPQTEGDTPQEAEKLISNITGKHREDSSLLTMPQRFLWAVLLI